MESWNLRFWTNVSWVAVCFTDLNPVSKPNQKSSQRDLKFLDAFFVCFVVIFLCVISWIVLLAYDTKTIHEGTRTITKKQEEESPQTLISDFCSILAKDLLTFSLPDIVRLVLRRLETQESKLSDLKGSETSVI